MSASFRTISALVLRYLFLYGRNPVRLIELFFWPLVDLLVWGFLTLFLQSDAGAGVTAPLGFLLGGMILWDILFRAQQGVSISFLEDVWTRNLLNVFAAPVRTWEYVGATCLVGLLRVALTFTVLTITAALAYHFHIGRLGLALLPFMANLILFGWFLGMVSTALILRFGQAAESLAWAVPFFIQPIAAVFYPLKVLPAWLQPISAILPCTPVFEGMRAVLAGHPLPLELLWRALVSNLVFGALVVLLFAHTLRWVKRAGLLVKVATQ